MHCLDDTAIVGVVTLELRGAQNLPCPAKKYRRYRKINPFVVTSYGRKVFRTRWVQSTVDPAWNETVHLTIRRSEVDKYMVVFSVYDYDHVGFNSSLATTNIRIQYFCDRPNESLNLALELLGNGTQEGCLLFVKGVFKTFESLELQFWEIIAIEEHSSRSGAVDAVQDSMPHERCPGCYRKQLKDQGGLAHAVVCVYKRQHENPNWSLGGFLTEEYASRKWFNRIIELLGFGGYRLGRNNGHVLVQDRKTGRVMEERIPLSIKLALCWMHHNTVNRRAIDWRLIRSLFHMLTLRQGQLYNSPQSARYIPDFIKYHKLNMNEVALSISEFASFNEFFYRKLKAGARILSFPKDPSVIVSPADCRLHCFPTIQAATELWIKGRRFTVRELLKDDDQQFAGGSLVICRLAPQDYHRFHSPVDGIITRVRQIPGAFFTVNPMAVRQSMDILTENTRTIINIESERHGQIALVAIGAMMVGSIVLTGGGMLNSRVRRMDEMGYFAFGGSTIGLVIEPGRVVFDADILENTRQPIETLVQVGERIGTAKTT